MEYVADRPGGCPATVSGVFADGPRGLCENGLPVANNVRTEWNPTLRSHLTMWSGVICVETYHSDMVELENGPNMLPS